MFSLRLYLHILTYVLLVVCTLGLGLAGILSHRAIIFGLLAVLLALVLMGSLVSYICSYLRQITFFLDSIKEHETMFHFPEHAGSKEQQHLYASFNRVYAQISKYKQKEFEHKLHQKEYESWEKLMRVLTHEIMNSITPIVSLSETLLSYYQPQRNTTGATVITGPTVSKTIRGLETIKSQGQNLISFTESYRQFSGLRQPDFTLFSLTDLVTDILILHQEDLQQQHIRISTDYYQPEISIRADKKMLAQVLINLLKNAMQALTEQTDKRIRINIHRPKHTLLIRITDNGAGIPSELLEDIFIPFFTTKQQGTGIGLSLSRQIIRIHGGDMAVTSIPFYETSFTISLPER